MKDSYEGSRPASQWRNADVVAQSDDPRAGLESATPDSGTAPKGLKANAKSEKSARKTVKSSLRQFTEDKTPLSKEAKKEVDDAVDRISNMIAHGDMDGARAEARNVARKHGKIDREVTWTETDDYLKAKNRELRETIRNMVFQLPS